MIAGNWEGLLEIKIVEASAAFLSTVDEGGQACGRCFPPSVELLAAHPGTAGLWGKLSSSSCPTSLPLSLLCHLAALALGFRGVLLR